MWLGSSNLGLGEHLGDQPLPTNGDEQRSWDGSDEDTAAEDCIKHTGKIEDNDGMQNYGQQFAANENSSDEDQQPDLLYRNNPNINFSSSNAAIYVFMLKF